MTGSESFYVQRMGTEQGPYTVPELLQQVKAGDVRSDTMVRQSSGPEGMWFRSAEIPGLYSDKEWLVALLLSFFVGIFGIDRFYLGYTVLGILKLRHPRRARDLGADRPDPHRHRQHDRRPGPTAAPITPLTRSAPRHPHVARPPLAPRSRA